MTGSAIVFGASGGIGAALVAALEQDGGYSSVLGLSRAGGDFDLERPETIDALAPRLRQVAPPALTIVATGLLQADNIRPERSWRELDAAQLARAFAVNTIGPSLIAKQIFPLLSKSDRAIFAVLSARVGSISDNRLGGWHSYRASKAALNMMVKCLAIELARTHPEAICVGLHPGTVDTAMSKPFQASVAPARLFTADHSAACLLSVIARLTPSDTGSCFAWDGAKIPA